MRMLFEVLDLSVASPATVSRCGMVYVDDAVLGYMAIVHKEAHSQLHNVMSAEMINYLVNSCLGIGFRKSIPNIIKLKQLIPVSIA